MTSHKLKTVFAVCCVAITLCGCVLQSRAALFPETKGVDALAALGTRFMSESLGKDGTWTREEGELTFTREGRHYVARNSKEKDEIEVLFVPLGKGRFVMQAQEAEDKPFAYMIATIADGHMILAPMLCDDLKTDSAVAATVTFENSDCWARGTWDTAAFTRAAKVLTPAKMRLTPLT